MAMGDDSRSTLHALAPTAQSGHARHTHPLHLRQPLAAESVPPTWDHMHPVTFLDRDLSGLADLASQPDATLVQADLEDGSPWPLPGRRFAAVVVTNYLWRPLLPALIGAVAPGGLLLYETFMRGNERFGKPGNPDFLLAPDELFERCKDAFDIRAFEQGEDNTPSPAMRQRICAIKR